MFEYIKNSKLEITVIGIWLVVLNKYRVFFRVVGIDTEQALTAFDSNLNWTLGSGRFASALLRKLLMPYGFNYDMAVIILIIGWLSTCVLYQYYLQKYGKLNKWFCLLFSAVFISCPIWVEQNYFLCSVFANVIGMAGTVVAAALLTESLQNGGKKRLICVAVILVIISIGIYQALLYLAIANCIIFLSLNAYAKNISIKSYLLSGIKCIVIVAVSTIGYFICSNMMVSFFYNVAVDYVGYTDAQSIIWKRMYWSSENIRQCLNEVVTYVLYTVSSDNLYGTPILVTVWGAFQLFLFMRLLVKKASADIMLIICNFLLLMAAYLGCLVFGGSVTVRELVVLPLTVAFEFVFLLSEAWREIIKMNVEGRVRKLVKVMFIAAGVCLTVGWSDEQMQLNHSDYVRYRSEVVMADAIMSEVRQTGGIADKKIMFVGKSGWRLPKSCIGGQTIGMTILAFDYEGPVGVNYRAYGFMQAMGYEYVKPTMEDIKKLNAAADQIEWGEKRIISQGNYVVVNLDRF